VHPTLLHICVDAWHVIGMTAARTLSTDVNLTRYRSGQRAGHYESFFVRANHPSRPLAFWIRYTLFSPRRGPEDAIGELWAIFFDGETGRHVAVKQEVPMGLCSFSASEFLVDIGDAYLRPGKLEGSAVSGAHAISWKLSFSGTAAPLFLLPPGLYRTGLPKAKSLVSLPFATFRGSLAVDRTVIDVSEWVGSQNHNWGSRHTDHYAWGQVCGFDNHAESFLEVGTARLKIGPLWTPFMTLLVLRHRGEEITLNSLRQSIRATASFTYFDWHFHSENDVVSIDGRIHAPREAFVGLRYLNPPGGIKHCLNSKLASCEVTLTNKRTASSEVLTTLHRAAFEILTDDVAHGVEMRV
jgi:hypothetical protein